jgi:hypothetical protein
VKPSNLSREQQRSFTVQNILEQQTIIHCSKYSRAAEDHSLFKYLRDAEDNILFILIQSSRMHCSKYSRAAEDHAMHCLKYYRAAEDHALFKILWSMRRYTNKKYFEGPEVHVPFKKFIPKKQKIMYS